MLFCTSASLAADEAVDAALEAILLVLRSVWAETLEVSLSSEIVGGQVAFTLDCSVDALQQKGPELVLDLSVEDLLAGVGGLRLVAQFDVLLKDFRGYDGFRGLGGHALVKFLCEVTVHIFLLPCLVSADLQLDTAEVFTCIIRDSDNFCTRSNINLS